MVRRNERGFALLMGLTVLVILTVLGLSVMSSMGEDLVVVQNMRESEVALALAEAGLAWGLEQLNDEPYRYDDNRDETALLVDANGLFSALSNGDEICTGLKTTGVPTQCESWQEITDPNNPEAFGDAGAATRGTFRVVFGDNDDGDGDYSTDADDLILIRALGVDPSGSKRLIEVAVTAGN